MRQRDLLLAGLGLLAVWQLAALLMLWVAIALLSLTIS